MREFRNRVGSTPRFRRLVYGVFDPETRRWDSPEPHPVPWSRMDPDDPTASFEGLDATPDVTTPRQSSCLSPAGRVGGAQTERCRWVRTSKPRAA